MEFRLDPWRAVGPDIDQRLVPVRPCCASGHRRSWDGAPGEFPLHSSALSESPGPRWRALSLNMAPALSICQCPGRISSGSINQKPTFGGLCPGPHLKVPAAAGASSNLAGTGRTGRPDLAGGQDGVNTDFGRWFPLREIQSSVTAWCSGSGRAPHWWTF